MEKKLLALSLSAIMILALAACGGKPTSTSTPDSTPTSTSTESAAPAADGKTYTTSINDADVTLTLSADEKSIVVDAMGMTVEGSCEVVDGVLTLKEQTSGNAQIWASLASLSLKLNDDGTAPAGCAQ